MKVALATIAFNEQRFIRPFLSHIPDWVGERLVLVSTKPWNGPNEPQDATATIAQEMSATVVERHWESEEAQRNTGQALLQDNDWILWLDPDEFMSDYDWEQLRGYLESSAADASVVRNQRVFWKNKEVSPCNDYQQLIVARPHVKFIDKRVVNSGYDVAPVELLHFSWGRTDDEVWSKITHYAHAKDFDTKKWFNEVWKANKQTDLHPTTPETLKALIDPILPPEIEKLKLLP